MNRNTALISTLLLFGFACGDGDSNVVGSRFVVSDDIGTGGGALSVSPDQHAELAGTTLIVPAGAVDVPALFGIAVATENVVPADIEPLGPAVDFEPDGQTFAVPVEISLPVPDDLTLDDLEIHALESDGTRRVIEPLAVADGIARFETAHFTGFQGGRRTAPRACQPADCGPQPGAPSYLCEDGTSGGFTGRCRRTAAGTCGWEINNCPPACTSNQACNGQVCVFRFDADGDGVDDAGTCEECASNADCAPGQTCDANNRCQGAATCTISVSPTSLQFQTVLGVAATRSIAVSDTGTSGSITAVSFTALGGPAFSTTFSAPASIGRGLSIPVTYTARSRQDAGEMLIETNQSVCGQITVTLSGVGVPCRSAADCGPGQQCVRDVCM